MPVAISTSGGAHGVCLAAITSVCETIFDFIELSTHLHQDRYHRDLSGPPLLTFGLAGASAWWGA